MKKRLIEPITKTLVDKIFQRALGFKTNANVTLLKGGLYNTSYKVVLHDRTVLVLRIAPPKDKPLLGYEDSLLKRETYFLSLLHSKGFSVPHVIFKDFSKGIISRDYIILEYCPGDNAFIKFENLTNDEQNRIYAQWGRFTSKIHAFINPEGWFGPPAPLKRHKTWSDFVKFYVRSLWNDLQKDSRLSRLVECDLNKLVSVMRPVLDEITSPRLVHGDLSLHNILIDGKGKECSITAILDWDRSIWGDPWFEWILHGLDLRPAFWEQYGTRGVEDLTFRQRLLLYKACGCLHAALEESFHFGKLKNAKQMLVYSRDNTNALLQLLK